MKVFASLLVASALLLTGCSTPDDTYSKDDVESYNSSNQPVAPVPEQESPEETPAPEPMAPAEAIELIKSIAVRPESESREEERLRAELSKRYGIYGPNPSSPNASSFVAAGKEYCSFRLTHEKQVVQVLSDKLWPYTVLDDIEAYLPQAKETIELVKDCKNAKGASQLQSALRALSLHEDEMALDPIDFGLILTILSERL